MVSASCEAATRPEAAEHTVTSTKMSLIEAIKHHEAGLETSGLAVYCVCFL